MKFTKTLTYSAVCTALAVTLSYVTLFRMPQGGSVSACSMIFITLVGYWFGIVPALMAGVVMGLMQLFLGGYVVGLFQMLLDYPLSFAALGLSGLFKKKSLPNIASLDWRLYAGFSLGAFGRLFCNFLSGLLFFSAYVPEGMNPYWYSFAYNASFIIPEMIISMILISIPAVRRAINAVK